MRPLHFNAATTLALLLSLGACSNTPGPSTLADVRNSSNPTDRAQRNQTSFTPALRCMDDLMFQRGTRDVSLMMEELRDATQKVPISARDMMTSAISDISRRSRGVRLSVFGTDQQNLIQFLQTAQKSTPFGVVPQFAIRGTVSQLDEGVQRSSATLGASLTETVLGMRFSSDTRFAVMAMDAAVVQTDTMTLLPGVIAKNTTVLVSRDANAEEGQAQLVKQGVGLVFSMSSSRADGPAQAARNMVELSTVELVGRLIKAPYWQCLGIADSDPEVQRELDDWFLSMEEGERIQFYKQRMREGRYYNGAIDAQTDAAFQSALRDYRQAMGLPKQGPLDEAFFRQLVTQSVPRKGTATTPSPTGAPMSLTLVGSQTQGKTPARLELRMNTPGYVYCYSQDEATGRIQRIFPNRFQTDPRLNPGKPLSLPGKASFQLNPSAQHACIHAPQEVYADLPPQLRWGDFEDIRLNSFEEIRQQFAQASGMKVVLVEQAAGRR